MKHIITFLLLFILTTLTSCFGSFDSQSEIPPNNSNTSNQKFQSKQNSLIQEENIKKTQKEYFIGDLKVVLNQYKGDGTEFICKSEIIISKDGKQTDSIKFTPEPVGGNYGISKAFKFSNHLIFNKYGDYDGRTLIINSKGEIYNIIGGENYLDTVSKILFSIYDSDLSGFAAFDLKTDSILKVIEEMESRPRSIHKNVENKYFISCVNDETSDSSIWEIDFGLARIKQIDLTTQIINANNELMKLPYDNVDCECY